MIEAVLFWIADLSHVVIPALAEKADVIRSEKILRKVEREIQKKEHRKRIRIVSTPSVLPSLPEQPPLAEYPQLVPPPPEPPMQDTLVTPEPYELYEPEVVVEPEFDFEADPMPEPEPDIPQYRF